MRPSLPAHYLRAAAVPAVLALAQRALALPAGPAAAEPAVDYRTRTINFIVTAVVAN